MKYMLMRKADADTENGVLPTEEILQAMADYNERMMQAGVFDSGQGLRPTREGCRIQFRNGEPTVINGPFEHTSELLAGYSVLEVDSLGKGARSSCRLNRLSGHTVSEWSRTVLEFNG